jgi:cytochrome bd-type quinol oxidase subunit 1
MDPCDSTPCLAQIRQARVIGPWLAIAALGLFGLFASLPPPPSQATTLMAVFPPWWTSHDVWQAAESAGYVVGVGRQSWAVVVYSKSDGLVSKLQHAGAWLVLDPRGLGLCSNQ